VAVAVREGAAFEAPPGDWNAVLPGFAETQGITVLERPGR